VLREHPWQKARSLLARSAMRGHAVPMGKTDGAGSTQGALFSRALADEPRKPWLIRVAVVGAVALFSLGLWLYVHNSEGGAVRAMAPAQREVLFKETWKAQRMRCTRTAEAGQTDTPEQCRKRAEFLLLFAQCDEACRAQLADSLAAPAERPGTQGL
jgi:cytochrome b pre-mRNA-processing protein 3